MRITAPPPQIFSKSVTYLLVIFSVFFSINSCKKEEKKIAVTTLEESASKVKPNFIKCDEGYHFDVRLQQCVPNCPSGYAYCPEIGDCIPNGTSCGGSRICGAEFNQFNLSGYTLSQVVEYIGSKHNAYQDTIYNALRADTSVLTNGTLQTFLKQKTTGFFNSLGINEANNPLPGNFDILDTSFVISGYSAAATTILNQLKDIVNGYTDENYNQEMINLESLKQQALNLSDFSEALAVAGSISVAKYSYQYWTNNLSKWYSLLHIINNGYANKQAPCGISVKAISRADVAGAIRGAWVGIGGGPIGAFAGGLLGAAVGSSGTVLWQAAKCIPYVGPIVRWIDDWIWPF